MSHDFGGDKRILQTFCFFSSLEFIYLHVIGIEPDTQFGQVCFGNVTFYGLSDMTLNVVVEMEIGKLAN
jgi:hypothetical protein